jgi:orotate phosphoribosyltransferase
MDLVRERGAELVGVGVLADRTGGTLDLGARLEAALTVSVEAYEPDACPLCQQGVPIYQPGTRPPS